MIFYAIWEQAYSFLAIMALKMVYIYIYIYIMFCMTSFILKQLLKLAFCNNAPT